MRQGAGRQYSHVSIQKHMIRLGTEAILLLSHSVEMGHMREQCHKGELQPYGFRLWRKISLSYLAMV